MSASHQYSSMPTPPFSPNPSLASPPDGSIQSTLNLLDSLVEFYQQERAWVQRTRIALEEAYQDSDSEAKQSDQPGILPSPPTDADTTSNSEPFDKPVLHDKPLAASNTQPTSRWSRRKKGFKLSLSLAPLNNRIMPSRPVRRIVSHKDFSQRKRLLEMLDQMMEARMESCHTVNRLVRNANRADLHCR